MSCSLATEARALAGRRGALFGPGKQRGQRAVLLSTLQKGTGTGSGGGSGKEYAIAFQVLGGVLGVASFTAVAVHHIDQSDIRRIEGEQAVEIKRIEGERRFAENHWRA
ncbi:Hypothetical protein NocV09_02900280, partial [Nannochloropsis oceanica]